MTEASKNLNINVMCVYISTCMSIHVYIHEYLYLFMCVHVRGCVRAYLYISLLCNTTESKYEWKINTSVDRSQRNINFRTFLHHSRSL